MSATVTRELYRAFIRESARLHAALPALAGEPSRAIARLVSDAGRGEDAPRCGPFTHISHLYSSTVSEGVNVTCALPVTESTGSPRQPLNAHTHVLRAAPSMLNDPDSIGSGRLLSESEVSQLEQADDVIAHLLRCGRGHGAALGDAGTVHARTRAGDSINYLHPRRHVLTGVCLLRLARHAFRRSSLSLDAGLAALRAARIAHTYAATYTRTLTELPVGPGEPLVRVSVSVRTRVLSAAGGRTGTYTVRIANLGRATVRVNARGWTFTHGALGGPARVSVVPRGSPGVVGHSPVIPPAAAFEYASYTQLQHDEAQGEGHARTPGPRVLGSMRGALQMSVHEAGEGEALGMGRRAGGGDVRTFDAIVADTAFIEGPGG